MRHITRLVPKLNKVPLPSLLASKQTNKWKQQTTHANCSHFPAPPNTSLIRRVCANFDKLPMLPFGGETCIHVLSGRWKDSIREGEIKTNALRNPQGEKCTPSILIEIQVGKAMELENFPFEGQANRMRANNKSGKLLAAPIEIEVQTCTELLRRMVGWLTPKKEEDLQPGVINGSQNHREVSLEERWRAAANWI